MPNTQTTQSLTPQLKVVVYQWENNNPPSDTPNNVLNRSTRLDISSQILSCSFSKTLSNPAGSFQLTLANAAPESGDWKDIIKPGSWLTIHMTQDGDLNPNPQVGPPLPTNKIEEGKRLRCVGFVDRVAVTSELGENGQFDIMFSVTGRDFGVVLSDSNVWRNLFKFDQIVVDSLGRTGLNILGTVKINEALKIVHDVLLYPANLEGARLNDENSLSSIGLQWLLPRELVTDVFHSARNVGGETFWGNIPQVTQFHTTEASLSIESPTDYLFGNVWENLKKIAVPELHELYTETNDQGEPRLTFRPIPWAISKEGYPVQGRHVQFYKDVDFVEVPAVDVFSFDLGESNQQRINSILVNVNTQLIRVEDNISTLQGTGFPSIESASIKRYGFRPNHISAHALTKNSEQSDGSSDVKLLVEFNHYLQDLWENAVFAESGSVNILGNNEVKVGKCIEFGEDTPYLNGKRFYIEGYVDTFSISEDGARDWNTSLFLTWGFEKADLLSNSNFERRNTNFTRSGEYTPI